MIIPTSPARMMKSASAPAAPKTPLRHSPPTPLYIHKQPTNPPENQKSETSLSPYGSAKQARGHVNIARPTPLHVAKRKASRTRAEVVRLQGVHHVVLVWCRGEEEGEAAGDFISGAKRGLPCFRSREVGLGLDPGGEGPLCRRRATLGTQIVRSGASAIFVK